MLSIFLIENFKIGSEIIMKNTFIIMKNAYSSGDDVGAN